MKPRSRRGLWGTIGIVVFIIILFAIFVDLGAVSRQLAAADWGWLLIASGTLLIGMAAYTTRWRIILANKPNWLPTFHAANAGLMLNIFIPLRAGEAARIVMLSRDEHVSLAEVTSSFVVERLFEQIMRLTALGVAVLFGVGISISIEAVSAAVLFILLTFGCLYWMVTHPEAVLEHWPPRLARLPHLSEAGVRTQLEGLLEGLSNVASVRRLAVVLLWSLLAWVIFFLFHLFVLLALQSSLSARDILAIAFGSLALAPPSAPSQPGLYNAAIVLPLSFVGFDKTLLTSYTVLLQGVQIIWMTALALWGLAKMGTSARELFMSTTPD